MDNIKYGDEMFIYAMVLTDEMEEMEEMGEHDQDAQNKEKRGILKHETD